MTMQRPWPWPRTMDALVAAPASHRVLMENSQVRVLEVVIEPGNREPEHTHEAASVMIVDEPARIRYYQRDALQFESPGRLASQASVRVRWMEPRGRALCREHRRVPLSRDPRRTQVMLAPCPHRAAAPARQPAPPRMKIQTHPASTMPVSAADRASSRIVMAVAARMKRIHAPAGRSAAVPDRGSAIRRHGLAACAGTGPPTPAG